jgi:hypothetical protein
MLKLLIDIEFGFFCSAQSLFTIFVKQEPTTGLRCIRHFEGEDVVQCGASQQKIKHFCIYRRGFRTVHFGEWRSFCLRGDGIDQQGQERR